MTRLALVALLLPPAAAQAADVRLIGVFAGKAAVLSVDGGAPKTVRIGQTWSGVRVHAVDRETAVVEFDGARRTLRQGQYVQGGAAGAGAAGTVTLTADARGHFVTPGTVNGGSVSFLVDTGASMITLSAGVADRLGLDYRKGTRGVVQTANGQTGAWRIRLDTVQIGAIRLHAIDAVVVENSPEIALLGMSFLNRVEMLRDGDSMRLRRRY